MLSLYTLPSSPALLLRRHVVFFSSLHPIQIAQPSFRLKKVFSPLILPWSPRTPRSPVSSFAASALPRLFHPRVSKCSRPLVHQSPAALFGIQPAFVRPTLKQDRFPPPSHLRANSDISLGALFPIRRVAFVTSFDHRRSDSFRGVKMIVTPPVPPRTIHGPPYFPRQISCSFPRSIESP